MSEKVCRFHIMWSVCCVRDSASQPADKNTMWSGAGIKIDLDNLLSSPSKTVQATYAPSMNQLAQGTSLSPSNPPPPPSSSSSSSFSAAGPNYNVNTASLMTSGPPSQHGMGMGAVGMGMGAVSMGMGAGGMGMSAGGMGMGYGPRPGMMPMYGGGYGMGQQPGMGMGPMGYGGMPPTMGAQQKLM